jgi:hypothetical protein
VRGAPGAPHQLLEHYVTAARRARHKQQTTQGTFLCPARPHDRDVWPLAERPAGVIVGAVD